MWIVFENLDEMGKPSGSVILTDGQAVPNNRWIVFEDLDEMGKPSGSVILTGGQANDGEYWLGE